MTTARLRHKFVLTNCDSCLSAPVSYAVCTTLDEYYVGESCN